MQTYGLFFLVALAIGGVLWVFVYPILSGERKAEQRMASVATFFGPTPISPTAQTSRGPTAVTPSRNTLPPCGSGLATIRQLLPSQCSTRGTNAEPFTVWPTAQASLAEIAVTALKRPD